MLANGEVRTLFDPVFTLKEGLSDVEPVSQMLFYYGNRFAALTWRSRTSPPVTYYANTPRRVGLLPTTSTTRRSPWSRLSREFVRSGLRSQLASWSPRDENIYETGSDKKKGPQLKPGPQFHPAACTPHPPEMTT